MYLPKKLGYIVHLILPPLFHVWVVLRVEYFFFMALNLNLADLSIMSELKSSPFGMWFVATVYIRFSAFDELKEQSSFHRLRPEELLNKKNRGGEEGREEWG